MIEVTWDIFWRKGERWLRENGKEFRLKDLAPNLEATWELENLELVQTMREGPNPTNLGCE